MAVDGVCLTIEVTVGARVSPVIVRVLLTRLLSAPFVNVFAATDNDDDRLWVFVVGVNIDVNTFGSAVAAMVDREPPLIVMSLSVKPVGIALKVRVMLAVSPDFIVALSLVRVRVGLTTAASLKSTTRLLVVAPVTIDALPPAKSPFAKVTVRLLMSSAFA